MRAFEFHIPVVGFGEDLDTAYEQAVGGLLTDPDGSVRGDVQYREITSDDYVEELVRAMEVTGLALSTSGEA